MSTNNEELLEEMYDLRNRLKMIESEMSNIRLQLQDETDKKRIEKKLDTIIELLQEMKKEE